MNEKVHSSVSAGFAGPTESVVGRFKLVSARLEAAIPENRKLLGFWSR